MFLDALLKFSDAQTGTLGGASTDIVDTLAAGDAYVACWFVVLVDTSFAGTGTASASFQLQSADASDFSSIAGSSAISLTSSSGFSISQLTAGKFYAVRIPPGAKRYIRGYVNVTSGVGNVFSAGAWDMFIVKDIDLLLNNRRNQLLP